jgi:capsular polysaccharide biosynthesis protein
LADRHLSEAEEMLRLTNVRVIQPALVPQTPRPIPLLVIAAGFVFGAFAGFGRVVLSYALHPVFFTSEGLEQATGIPVLAVFAREPEFAG